MTHCDWDNNPPASEWDLARRSVLELTEMAENMLANLHYIIRSHPESAKPALGDVTKMIENAAAASRHARDIDNVLRLYIDKTWPRH